MANLLPPIPAAEGDVYQSFPYTDVRLIHHPSGHFVIGSNWGTVFASGASKGRPFHDLYRLAVSKTDDPADGWWFYDTILESPLTGRRNQYESTDPGATRCSTDYQSLGYDFSNMILSAVYGCTDNASPPKSVDLGVSPLIAAFSIQDLATGKLSPTGKLWYNETQPNGTPPQAPAAAANRYGGTLKPTTSFLVGREAGEACVDPAKPPANPPPPAKIELWQLSGPGAIGTPGGSSTLRLRTLPLKQPNWCARVKSPEPPKGSKNFVLTDNRGKTGTVFKAVVSNGHLFLATDASAFVAGATVNAVRLARLSNLDSIPLQDLDTLVYGNGDGDQADQVADRPSYAYPALEVNRAGDAGITFMRTGPATYPEVRVTNLGFNQTMPALSRLVQAGLQSYTDATGGKGNPPPAPNYLEDTAGADIDPDGVGVWTSLAYASKGTEPAFDFAVAKSFGDAHPDLTIFEDSQTDIPSSSGLCAKPQLHVVNQGDGVAPATAVSAFLVDNGTLGRQVGTAKLRSLSSGSDEVLTVPVCLFGRSGPQKLAFVVDPGHSIPDEYSVANNTLSATISVTTASISTRASGTVALGGAITDTATLSGGSAPTGRITFGVFGPNNALCSGSPVSTSTQTVDGNNRYTSAPFTPPTAGTYRFIAAYSGDAANDAANTRCNDPGESVVVSTQTTTTSTSLPSTTTTTTTSITLPSTTTTSNPSLPSTTTTTPSTSLPSTTTTTSTTIGGTTIPPGGPTVRANPSTLPAGETTVVIGTGFTGGSQLLVTLYSAPVLLATTAADARGNYQVTVTIPAGTAPGGHALVVSTASGNQQAQTTVTVTATGGATSNTSQPGALSFTGAITRGPITVALILVVLGLGCVAITRRRLGTWSGRPRSR